jgi:replication initiation and membrane attachment protein
MLSSSSISKSELIIKLSFVYGFDFDTTVNVVKNSINDKHNIDKDKLKNNYRTYYQFENNGSMPKVVFKCQPAHLTKEITDTSKKSKIIYQFENTTPYNYICAKSKTSKPTKAEMSILEMLLVDMDMKPGVVNVLIDYVLRINSNKLSKNFVEAIASQWKRSNIETVEAAMEISKQEHKQKNNFTPKVSSNKVKTEEKPAWFDKNIEAKEDLEKQRKLEEMLGRM